MHSLRRSLRMTRLVLAWFLLTLGVAVASPVLHAPSWQLVCSASGSAKLVVIGEDGKAVGIGHSALDCPMCLGAVAPPPSLQVQAPLAQPLAHALQPAFSAHIAALVGAPLPARGPPARA